VVKIQAWTTGRAGVGGVAFAKKPEDVRAQAERMLSMKVGQFPVEAVLVEEKLDIVTAKDFCPLANSRDVAAATPPRRSLVTLATYP
jgi:succinyl-CoA synthetase beta subunit